MMPLSRKDAEAQGFIVDTTTYPWFAYRGPRFNPEKFEYVDTDKEVLVPELVEALKMARQVLEAPHTKQDRLSTCAEIDVVLERYERVK